MLAAAAAHLVVLTAMVLGLDNRPPPGAETVLEVTLTPPLVSAGRRHTPARASPPTQARSPVPQTPLDRPALPIPGPAPPSLVAPAIPGARPDAIGPVGPGPGPTRQALRASTGCDSADYLPLPPAETARCEARTRRLRAGAKATYAVIDPEKKDFFDGTCKRDDEWCLYRTGQGPYPGLLAIGRKKKPAW